MRRPDTSTSSKDSKTPPDDFGHRWEMCALARRIDPAEMYLIDGGCAVYVTWLGHRWREFDAEFGGRNGAHTEAEHREFDLWLRGRALELADEGDEG